MIGFFRRSSRADPRFVDEGHVMYGVGLHRTTSQTTVLVLLVVYPLFLMSFQEARAQGNVTLSVHFQE